MARLTKPTLDQFVTGSNLEHDIHLGIVGIPFCIPKTFGSARSGPRSGADRAACNLDRRALCNEVGLGRWALCLMNLVDALNTGYSKSS